MGCGGAGRGGKDDCIAGGAGGTSELADFPSGSKSATWEAIIFDSQRCGNVNPTQEH